MGLNGRPIRHADIDTIMMTITVAESPETEAGVDLDLAGNNSILAAFRPENDRFTNPRRFHSRSFEIKIRRSTTPSRSADRGHMRQMRNASGEISPLDALKKSGKSQITVLESLR
jgi:hypothetical protein